MDKEDYQVMAECIRSGQIPESAIVEIMREDPQFAQWYRNRYKLPADKEGHEGPAGDSAKTS